MSVSLRNLTFREGVELSGVATDLSFKPSVSRVSSWFGFAGSDSGEWGRKRYVRHSFLSFPNLVEGLRKKSCG